jgi:chromosome segregation ATPase
MNPYYRRCDRCENTIREEDKRARWGEQIICTICYDELRHVEASEYKPVAESAENKKSTIETEAEHLKDLVRYYHGLWDSTEKENKELNAKLIHVESTLEYVRERCRNVMETSRKRFDEIRKLKSEIDSLNTKAVQQEFRNAEIQEEIESLKINTIPKEFGTGELLIRISELEKANCDLHFELSQYNRTELLAEAERLTRALEEIVTEGEAYHEHYCRDIARKALRNDEA